MNELEKLLALEFGSMEPIKTYVVYSGGINYLVFGLGAAESMSFIKIEKLVTAFIEATNFPKETIRLWQMIKPRAFLKHSACLYIFSYEEDIKQEKIIGAQDVADVWEYLK